MKDTAANITQKDGSILLLSILLLLLLDRVVSVVAGSLVVVLSCRGAAVVQRLLYDLSNGRYVRSERALLDNAMLVPVPCTTYLTDQRL